MTAFVILAAGRGSRVGRVGDELHKALLPLDGRAVLSHQLAQVPTGCRIVVAVGYRAAQVREYVRLAHPGLSVQFVDVEDWNLGGGGPGASLLACRDAVGADDVFVTSCDTLWAPDPELLTTGQDSWIGTAPVPPDTLLARWCVAERDELGAVIRLHDKCDDDHVQQARSFNRLVAYVGLAYISAADAPMFWRGVATGRLAAGERQVTGGLIALQQEKLLGTRSVAWTDVGDERSYRQAVARFSGYDWTKVGQATYVLPDAGRVVKFYADESVIHSRRLRGALLHGVPELVDADATGTMLAYRYVPGETVYAALERCDVVTDLLKWHDTCFAQPIRVPPEPDETRAACQQFYWRKTEQRIDVLYETRPDLARQARALVDLIDFDSLGAGCVPAYAHGDFNFGNVIVVTPEHVRETGHPFVALDWRESFAGHAWSDVRYDLGKLLAGCVVHWDAARRGDFRPWVLSDRYAAVIRAYVRRHYPTQERSIEIIGALSLLNCAPLHAAPLDEVLVARGCAWLQAALG